MKYGKVLHNRLFILMSIGVLISVIGTPIIRALPGIHRLELLVYDWHARALPRIAPDDRIVIVGMDDESLSHLPLERPAYPLPRTLHAQLIRELQAAGAKVIGLDMMFTREIPKEDEVLGQAMREYGNVLSGVESVFHPDPGGWWEARRFLDVASGLRPHMRKVSLLVTKQFNTLLIEPWTTDYETGQRYRHMTAALAETYLGAPNTINPPVGRAGEMVVRLAGPAGTYTPIPYHQVFSGDWRRSHGSSFFKDKIVLVGAMDPLMDRHATPLGQMQGVEILAQTTQQMLTSNWIIHWSEATNFLMKVALCLILAIAIWKWGVRRALLIGGVEAVVWIIAAHELFAWRGAWIDTVEPIGTLGLSLVVCTTYETTRIRRVFQRFMPSWVANEMLEASPEQKATTVEKELTIVFCDIRDSTRLGETLPSETIEELLRRYFVAGEEAAIRLGTELDKFVGDEIMLFFEERAGYEDHALRGVQWALAIHEAAQQITDSGLAGSIGFRVGVGVCTGRARLGLVGAKQRIQHTVVGDAVNTAARFQSATKDLGRGTVVGESTWERVCHRVQGEDLGEISVKGKLKPLRVFCPTRILN